MAAPVIPSFKESDFYLNIEDVSLSEQIGAGAFSKVYVGMYLGELVAVKRQARVEEDLEAYLLRELGVLKHFEHRNLLNYIGACNVDIKDGDQVATHTYIVTELAENGDVLGLLLGDQPIGWKLRVNILMDATRALEFLHSKGLIHRDIKSPNLLLAANCACKIADFGMARMLGQDMTIVGTDAYMAPELMFDEPYGNAADMFSLGIVFWECIYRQKAGTNDFCCRRPSDRFMLDIEELRDNAPEDTPPSLMELACQLCEYEQDDRPSAEDTYMWLDDLINDLDDDEVPMPQPIDYMSMYLASRPSIKRKESRACTGSSVSPERVGSSVSPERVMAKGASGSGYTQGNSNLSSNGGNAKGRGSSNSNSQGLGGTVGNSLQSGLSSMAGSIFGGSTVLGRRASPASLADSGNLGISRRSSSGSLVGAAHAPITRCGYLHKKGKSGLKNWQKRWFVLEGSRLIWFKDSRHYPRDPRGFLELKGCFIVRGLYFRWKVLSADGKSDQEDYNREFSAKDAGDMDQWLKAMQEAIESADVGDNDPGELISYHIFTPNLLGILLNCLSFVAVQFHVDRTVEQWLEDLGLASLRATFYDNGYYDYLLIQELGLVEEDLAYLGITNSAQKKVIKLAAQGLMETVLSADIVGFFNFGSELVYRLEAKWGFFRASTFFRFSDFEELHRKMRAAMKDKPKLHKLIPPLPARPASKPGNISVKLGAIDHATQMARLQQALNIYIQKMVMLVGSKEPFFTMIMSHFDLLPATNSINN
ncbi:unnamed protein product [Chrysoparadoxa australica]